MRSFVAMLVKMFKYVTRVLFDTRNWTFDYFRVEYLDSNGDLARPAQCLISVNSKDSNNLHFGIPFKIYRNLKRF